MVNSKTCRDVDTLIKIQDGKNKFRDWIQIFQVCKSLFGRPIFGGEDIVKAT